MVIRALIPALLLFLVSACQAASQTPPGGSTTPAGSALPDPTEASASPSASGGDVSPPPSGDLLTDEHSGATVELDVSETVDLQLSSEWTWDITDMSGNAVDPVPVNYAQDPGYYHWEIQAVAAGESELRLTGNANCGDTTVCPPREVEYRFVVTD